MLSRMPAHTFDEWKAFSRMNPFATEATFLAAAQIVSAIFNTNRKKNSRIISPADIVPDFVGALKQRLDMADITVSERQAQTRQRRQTTQEQIAIVEQLNKMFGGRDLRDKETHG